MTFGKLITLIISVCLIALNATAARVSPTVWDVIRSQFSINHNVSQPDVHAQLQWLLDHPGYLQKLARSEPYIYHIINEVRKKNMPGELALLPMLESAYDPFAYSGVGAAGLWQLMPATGTDLGLKQDWWYDARRSIRPSTDAALNYLAYLNRYFSGDWLLAVAAYDAGAGTVSRAIKTSGQQRNINFWALPLPAETKAYVPRLLALAEIIQYPQRYGVTLPYIPHIPYFEEVNIGSQIDLSHAARLAGMRYKDLIKLNPGYNRWATAPYKPFNLLIPRDRVESFNRNLLRLPQDSRVSWNRHQVRTGDSLDSIARRYFTTVKLLRELNQLKSDQLKSGQSILIPSMKNAPAVSRIRPIPPVPDRPPSTETYKVIHIVQPGDTLPGIEKQYQVSAQKIAEWNQGEGEFRLSQGQQLIIWRERIKPGVYTVAQGDSLSGIARRYHTSVPSLLKLNPGMKTQVLTPGQRLNVG
ncbi:LysM peptidoglycan-binding domain-containing protein [Legionella sp. CNM-4043-24]|uniref:LysM peptidoglycan-binding domain-containing protein n=1 Tax=Legionella sp. CNM-4043-24 TaxID=3421646 RepID=UPI00403ABBD0